MLLFQLAPSAASPELPELGRESSRLELFRRFVGLGAEHVLTGYDHLLFLIGVLVACRAARSVLALITCFTVAHSLTLALTVLGHVSAPGRVVEPLIAASIVVVGVDNLRRGARPWQRSAVTFAFGLVHGLGFAGALGRLELGEREWPLALFSFNLGIELGQLAVAAIAVPVILRLRRSRLGHQVFAYSSLALAGTGLFWLAERLAS